MLKLWGAIWGSLKTDFEDSKGKNGYSPPWDSFSFGGKIEIKVGHFLNTKLLLCSKLNVSQGPKGGLALCYVLPFFLREFPQKMFRTI